LLANGRVNSVQSSAFQTPMSMCVLEIQGSRRCYRVRPPGM
jgi:hypothetical protein